MKITFNVTLDIITLLKLYLICVVIYCHWWVLLSTCVISIIIDGRYVFSHTKLFIKLLIYFILKIHVTVCYLKNDMVGIIQVKMVSIP